MKNRFLLFYLIALHLVIAWFAISRRKSPVIPLPPAAIVSATSNPAVIYTTNVVFSTNSVEKWQNIANSNFRSYIANLQSMDCPLPIIQDIIRGEMHRYFVKAVAAQNRLSKEEIASWAYWRVDPAEKKLQSREINAIVDGKVHESMRELFGPEYERQQFQNMLTKDVDQIISLTIGFLPESKQEAIRPILEAFHSEQRQVFQARGENEAEMLQNVYRSKIEQLRQYLEPEELEAIELRDSPLAKGLRKQAAAIPDLTEAEFQQLYHVRKAYSEAEGLLNPQKDRISPEAFVDEYRKLTELNASEEKRILGEERLKLLHRR
jgi:hypothetical protein